MKQSVTRLFEGFKPENYALSICLDPEKMVFSGTVTIKGQKVGRPSQRLTFHQKGLKITEASAVKHDKKGDEAVAFDRINTQDSYDELRLHAKTMLYPGVYTVTITFSGKITEPMNGLYPCHFEEKGKKQKFLATQFESHHARDVFPCIDEPEAKATFDLTLLTPTDGTSVIANTPVKEQGKKDGQLVTTFETTPIMSTYLLAFVQGNIKSKEATTANGTLVRTFATPENIQHTGFALETAVKCLEFYEEYFDIPFPLPKIDMIALPDFSSGAMENWGLITYREQCLVVDPKNTSLPVKQFVAMVVAHELAHQWFGNLVTMRWWTDLWLNEGFASWIEYLAVDHLFPEWGMWTQFIVDEQQAALKLDALDNTHPIEVSINHPDEIRSIFDAISYGKGASVIHMLHGYLGPEKFRAGLQHYLKKYAYKNTDTLDLWQALEDVSKKPVKDFMHAWTSLPGFPIVSYSRDGDGVKLSQERFYLQKPKKVAEKRWPVPVLGPEGSPESFDTAAEQFTATGVGKINQGQNGFYRTFYDIDTITNLSLGISGMEPLDRLGLLADSFEAVKAGYASLDTALNLLAAYHDESNAAVWDIIALNIGELRRVMDDDNVREKMKPFVIDLTAKEFARLGWEEIENESHFDRLQRPTIIGLNASADEPSVVKECLRLFDGMKRPEDLPTDLRGIIYTTAARNGDEKTFDKLLSIHNETANSEERVTISAAITAFKQPELIARALDIISTDTVRHQDAMYWLAYSFGNRYAKEMTWKWFVKHWDWLESNMGSDLSFFRTPIYAARAFSNPEFLKTYQGFFKDKKTPSIERSIRQGEELLAWQIGWKKRDLQTLIDFLNS